MKLSPSLINDVPLMPVVYARVLMRLMSQLGVSQSQMLSETGILSSQLADPEGHISISQLFTLFRHAQRLSPVAVPGARYGMQLDLAAHGLLAYSLLAQQRIDDLTRRLIQFLRVRVPLMDLELIPSGPGAIVRLHARWPMEDVEDFLVDSYLGSMTRIASTLSKDIRVHLKSSDTSRCEALSRTLGIQVSGGQSNTQLLISQCPAINEADRDEPTNAEQRDWSQDQVVALIRHYIQCHPGRYCTLDHAAAQLGLTPRTLTRYLSLAGHSFSQLRNHARLQFALHYLQDTDYSIADIAEKLGYSDQASFTKAFRSWTGFSPGRVRREGKVVLATLVSHAPTAQHAQVADTDAAHPLRRATDRQPF